MPRKKKEEQSWSQDAADFYDETVESVEEFSDDALDWVEEAYDDVTDMLFETETETHSRNGYELVRSGGEWQVSKNGRVVYRNELKENAERFIDARS